MCEPSSIVYCMVIILLIRSCSGGPFGYIDCPTGYDAHGVLALPGRCELDGTKPQSRIPSF
jgi:hypothetical protein